MSTLCSINVKQCKREPAIPRSRKHGTYPVFWPVGLDTLTTVNTRTPQTPGTTKPDLLLHSVVVAVTAAIARVTDGAPASDGDSKAFRRAAAAIQREIEETHFLGPAGKQGRSLSPGPSGRVDLAGLLRAAAEQDRRALRVNEGSVQALRNLDRLAEAVHPAGVVTGRDRETATMLLPLFNQATRMVGHVRRTERTRPHEPVLGPALGAKP